MTLAIKTLPFLISSILLIGCGNTTDNSDNVDKKSGETGICYATLEGTVQPILLCASGVSQTSCEQETEGNGHFSTTQTCEEKGAIYQVPNDTLDGKQVFSDNNDANNTLLDEPTTHPTVTLQRTTITIDGNISDWEGIAPIVTTTSDSIAFAALDITAAYLAEDDNYLYIRLDRVDASNYPLQEYYNFWIYFKDQNNVTRAAIESFHDDANMVSVRIHDSDYHIVSTNIAYNIQGDHMEYALPKSYLSDTLYNFTFFTHYTSNLTWVDDNGEHAIDMYPIQLSN